MRSFFFKIIMICYLKGTVLDIGSNFITLVVGGVGYKVFCSSSDLVKITSGQLDLECYIHTYFKQDRLELYGFFDRQSLSLFELCLTVSGVGPKCAISIFSQSGSDQIKQAFISSDVDFFARVKGVGKKTAQKLVLELRDKVGSLDDSFASLLGIGDDEVVYTLKQLGYKKEEVMVITANLDSNLSLEDRVKQALKLMSRGNR